MRENLQFAGFLLMMALTAMALAFLAGCGGEKSAYDEGYDQGVSVSGVSEADVPPATGDRCLDLSLRWYVMNQAEHGLTVDDQNEFRRGCRAGTGKG